MGRTRAVETEASLSPSSSCDPPTRDTALCEGLTEASGSTQDGWAREGLTIGNAAHTRRHRSCRALRPSSGQARDWPADSSTQFRSVVFGGGLPKRHASRTRSGEVRFTTRPAFPSRFARRLRGYSLPWMKTRHPEPYRPSPVLHRGFTASWRKRFIHLFQTENRTEFRRRAQRINNNYFVTMRSR